MPTNFLVDLQAVANILLPSNNAIAKMVPQVQTFDTVDIESSFNINPISVVIPTASDACVRINKGIFNPDFPNLKSRYIIQLNDPSDQRSKPAGYAGVSISSCLVTN
jgi:hypothetical protein